MGTMTFDVDVRGAGQSATTAPSWSRLLAACGFAISTDTGVASISQPRPNVRNFSTVTIVATSGTPVTGTYVGTKSGYYLSELLTVSAGSVTIRHELFPDDGTAVVTSTTTHTTAVPAQVVGNGPTLTITSPAAAAAPAWRVGDQWRFEVVAAGQAGIKHMLHSGTIPSLDMAMLQDGRLVKLSGCRGKVKLGLKWSESGIFSFEFQGVVANASAGFEDRALLDTLTVPYDQATPPPPRRVDQLHGLRFSRLLQPGD